MSIYDENQLLRILRSFGEIDLDHFNDRLRLQKLGFLAQEMGAKGDFPYSWYLRGPYSSSLSSTLFMGVEVDAFRDHVHLNQDEQGIVRKMQNLLGDRICDPETLELFASVWYLIPNRKLSQGDISNIVEIMHDEKPRYPKELVRDTIKKIASFLN